MAYFFRRPRSSNRAFWRRRAAPFSKLGLTTTTFTSDGVATAAFVGSGRAATVFTSAGAATVSSAITGRFLTTFTSAGIAATSFPASGHAVGILTAAGSASVSFVPTLNQVISTNILQKPIDYALAGDQDQKMPFKSGRLAGRAMRHAFNE